MSELHDVDFVVLSQARVIKRRNRAITAAFIRLAAAHLTSSPKRYIQLIEQATKIIGKAAKDIYEMRQADKKENRRKKR